MKEIACEPVPWPRAESKYNPGWRTFNLLITLVLRDFQVRYAQSVLGWAWAILQPLALMLTFTFLQRFLHINTGGVPYPIFVLAALLPWSFFSTAVTQASHSLVSNTNLIKKVHLPRALFPAAAVVTALVDFLVSLLLLFSLLLYYHQPLSAKLLMLPLLLVPTLLFALGLGLLTSGLMVFARDLRFALPFILQLAMYVSPVLYSAQAVPEKYQTYFRLNPVVPTIEGFRAVILHNQWPDMAGFFQAALMTVFLLFIFYWGFRKSEKVFADII